jgi:hypothetical protein
MEGCKIDVISPSPPSSVPAVLAVKGIAPETALAACGGASVPTGAVARVPPAGAQQTAGEEIRCIAPADQ